MKDIFTLFYPVLLFYREFFIYLKKMNEVVLKIQIYDYRYRLRSQQLVNPAFNDPKELVAWMGALQGQSIVWRSGPWGYG